MLSQRVAILLVCQPFVHGAVLPVLMGTTTAAPSRPRMKHPVRTLEYTCTLALSIFLGFSGFQFFQLKIFGLPLE